MANRTNSSVVTTTVTPELQHQLDFLAHGMRMDYRRAKTKGVKPSVLRMIREKMVTLKTIVEMAGLTITPEPLYLAQLEANRLPEEPCPF